MTLARALGVFLLCAVVSVLLLDGVTLLMSAGSSSLDLKDVGWGSLVFLPFVVLGGVVFGSICLLTVGPADRKSSTRLMRVGFVSGLIYSALILISFGALVPQALVLVAASALAGCASGYLWSRLFEQARDA